jgi:hypothetical protein
MRKSRDRDSGKRMREGSCDEIHAACEGEAEGSGEDRQQPSTERTLWPNDDVGCAVAVVDVDSLLRRRRHAVARMGCTNVESARGV